MNSETRPVMKLATNSAGSASSSLRNARPTDRNRRNWPDRESDRPRCYRGPAFGSPQWPGAAPSASYLTRPNHILIAVSDDSIPQVAAELAAAGLRDSTIVHTSAAAGPEALAILRTAGNSIGVLHPLQTVPSAERGIETLPGATWAVAGDDRATAWALRTGAPSRRERPRHRSPALGSLPCSGRHGV